MKEVERHKTTIKFVKENWVKLQNLAAIKNSSPTAILNQLLDSYVNENLPEDYEKRIQERVHKELDNHITDALLDDLSLRVAFRLGLKIDTVDTTSTTTIDSTDGTDSIDNTICTSSTTKKSNTSNTTSTTKKKVQTEEQREAKRSANIAKFRRYNVRDNKKGYSDGYVANEEGVSKQTINRYRRGDRSPKSDFYDRWGLNWNGEQWVKNLENEEFSDVK